MNATRTLAMQALHESTGMASRNVSRAHRFIGAAAFSLVELLVAMGILAILMVVTLAMVNQTRALFTNTTGKVSSFRESRAAFESLTRRLSQASLNTYFDYVDTTGRTRKEVEALGDIFTPAQYVRQSELHFVNGSADTLVPAKPGTQHPGHAVFFQAMLGFSSVPASGSSHLSNLLNACGFFVEYGSDAGFRAPFLTNAGVAEKKRYRLMQMVQNTEGLSIYNQPMTNSNKFDWFQSALSASPSPARPIAENIVAAVFWPRRSAQDPANATPLTVDFAYDSKAYLTGGNEISRNQLPPFIQVTLVAIDEPSAARLEAKFPDGSAPLLAPGALFMDETTFEDDLIALTDFLNSQRLNYQIFTTNVLIRQSKFSAQ